MLKPDYSPELKAVRHEILRRSMQLDLEPVVLGDGRLDAEIVIVGQGPGSHEVAGKSPFVGPTGNLLWNTLRQHGILRTDCYVTNVCKRQYSIDKKNDLGKDEWTKWFSVLDWELEQLKNAKVIFALGNAALEGLLGYTGITDYRGSVYQRNGVYVLPSFNPANILRSPENEIIFQFDAQRLRKISLGDWEEWPVDTRYDLTFEEALSEIKRFKVENKPTAVDLELTALELACVGLANDEHRATCINFRGQLENRYTRDQEIQLLFALQDLYESLARDDNLIVQNGAFDAGWSGIKDHMHMPVSFDTMLMHHTLYPTLPHSLGFLTSQYTTIPYYKDEFDDFKETGDVTTLWEYNGKDACATLASFFKLRAELRHQKLWDFYCNHVKRLQNHAIQSTVAGIATDHDVRQQVAAALRDEVNQALSHVHALINDALPEYQGRYKPNINSWQQLQVLFYDRLKLKDFMRGTDEDTRNKLINDARTPLEAREILVAINKYKELAKFAGTYVELKLDDDGRFRCVWKQEGVRSAPGRLSSSKTLWGTGMNGQNQPPAAKKFFIADEGCCLIYFDLKQAEAQVVAYRADIPQWKDDFARTWTDAGFDAHRSLAASMFNVPYDEVPKEDRNEDDTDYTIRYTAKRCRHGLNYRMQIARLAETASLSYSRAAKAFNLYHRVNPEIQRWWREQEHLIKKERQMFNAFGRRFKVLSRITEETLIPIIAFYPQSTIGDKVCSVWYQAEEDDRWDNHKARVILNVHDALIAVATIPYAKTALSILKAYAQTPILIENVYRTKRDLLRIGADTAISSLEIKDKKGNIIGMDKYHRWSNLQKVYIEEAPLGPELKVAA